MLFLMPFVVGCFLVCTIYGVRAFSRHFLEENRGRLQKAREDHEQMIQERENVLKEKKRREREAIEIFTLYEMTREIAKKFKEEEAFEVFNAKLKDNVSFKECRFVSGAVIPQDPGNDDKNNFIFELRSKREKIGYLVIEELLPEDRDKVNILAHQFALALRRVKLYRDIEELAITDSLTGVYTRRYFAERFEEEFKRSANRKINLSFLMIDADHFKDFNDHYGHLVGDEILRSIAGIIKGSIREIDFLGRYGGEEFCVVLPDTAKQGAILAAERMRVAVEERPIKAYDVSVNVTVSAGIATFPFDGKTAMEIVDKADWALYRAKKEGRNRVCAFGVYE